MGNKTLSGSTGDHKSGPCEQRGFAHMASDNDRPAQFFQLFNHFQGSYKATHLRYFDIRYEIPCNISVKRQIIESANTFIQNNREPRSSAEFAYIFGIFRPDRFFHGKCSPSPQHHCILYSFVTAILPQIIGIKTNTNGLGMMLHRQFFKNI